MGVSDKAQEKTLRILIYTSIYKKIILKFIVCISFVDSMTPNGAKLKKNNS